MVKRALPSSSSSSPTKKLKIPPNQHSLDRFFTKKPGESSESGQIPEFNTHTSTQSPDTKTLRQQAPPDAKTIERRPAGTDSKQHASHEIIDVDSLDEVILQTSSSALRVEKADGLKFSPSPIFHSPRATVSGDTQHDLSNYPLLSVDPPTLSFDDVPFSPNSPLPYSFLAHALDTLSSTRSRILILNTLTNALRTIVRFHPASLLPSLYLLSNSLSPSYSAVELGLGPSIISKAIMNVSGLSSAALKKLYAKTGDAGDVAFEAKSNIRTLIPHPPLLITVLYDSLLKIAHAKGQGAVKQKQAIVEKLLVAAKGEEVRFLVRTLSQHIRVGAVRTSILTALARAMVLTPPSSLTVLIADDSPLHASPDLISQAKAITTKNTSKKVVDEAKEELIVKFARAESLIRKVFVQHPNYDHMVVALLDAGLDGLSERVPLTVGIPLHPTLGSPMRSLAEVYERLGDLPFVAEFKYDGQRAQIHAWKDEDSDISVKIFSRHLEDMTEKYPDITSMVHHIFSESPSMSSFILDSEIVAIDVGDGGLKSFQELSNRPRKSVQLQDIKVAVCVFGFDLMYLNGEILLETPFRHRRALLRNHFPSVIPTQKGAARFDHVESCESEEGTEAIEEFWMRSVDSRCEGLMIKLLDSGDIAESAKEKGEGSRKKPLPATYEPDKRTSAWLKLKKDYVMGIGDSLDLIPVGAWHGNGRKAQWWSPVLLALRDPDSGRLVAMCKCMSGFSDSFYKAMRERYSEASQNCSKHPLWSDVDMGGYKPSVYFRPHEVWEIRGADITLSPVSVAAQGLVSDTRGLSLRFPRFIRVREDKATEQASSPEFLVGIWKDQQGKGRDQAGADEGQLIDADMSEEEADENSGDEELG